MIIFRHPTGRIMELNEGDPRIRIYSESPSWIKIIPEEIIEETKEDSSYDKIKKDNLISLAKERNIEINKTMTKKEIIEKLEDNDKDYAFDKSIRFNDNLI